MDLLGVIFGATFGGLVRTGGGTCEDDDIDDVIGKPLGGFMLPPVMGETMEWVWLRKEEVEFKLSSRFKVSF